MSRKVLAVMNECIECGDVYQDFVPEGEPIVSVTVCPDCMWDLEFQARAGTLGAEE